MKRNAQQLVNMRCIVAIMIGVTAGILGFDGPVGIAYFFAINLIVSCWLALRFGFNPKPYFKNVTQIMQTGATANFMTFAVTWVFCYNLVYIL